MISHVMGALRRPLDEERRASLAIQIVARWALIGAAMMETNFARGTSGVTYLVLNVLIAGAAVVNLLLMWRLRNPRPLSVGVAGAASLYDVFAITAAVATVDKFNNVNFLFYFPAFVAFALVFPGRRGVIFTVVTMAVYTAIVTTHENFDPHNGVEMKQLIVRLTTMGVATTIANMVVRIERRRRMLAVRQALAAHVEHQRVTQEIHDGIAQEIYMLAVNLEANAKVVAQQTTDTALHERMTALVALAKQALLETRSLLFNLEPALTGEEGLVSLLRGQAAEFSAVTRIPVTVTADGAGAAVEATTAVELYRIVQEGLANMYKHAGARRAVLGISEQHGTLSIRLSDDGCGFDPAAPPRRGRGLSGMQERAARIDGTLAFESAPGRGTSVTVTVPLRRP